MIWMDPTNYTEYDEELGNVTFVPDCSKFGPEGLLSSLSFQMGVYGMYLLIFVCALIGNALVCYVVIFSPRMSTVTNIFIGHLAFSDILMTVFCVPFSFVPVLLQYWHLGIWMCRIVKFVQVVSVLVSSYAMVAISIDRYMNILRPLKPRMSKRTAHIIMACVWSLALVAAVPIPLVSTLEQPSILYRHCDKFVCDENWWSPDIRLFYSFCMPGLQCVIPLAVLLFNYISIANVVWRRATPGETYSARDRRIHKSKIKTIQMIIMVVLVFTICWLPFNIFMLIWEVWPKLMKWDFLPYVYLAVHWLAMSHASYNPLIYSWLNPSFRSEFVVTFNRLFCKKNLPPEQALRPLNTTRPMHVTRGGRQRRRISYREHQV